MQELTALILRAQTGDISAYDHLVLRFQDMAVAYAYSVVGNVSDAEDAAQEAFIEAHRCLVNLQHPLAFSRWLRRIVWKHCDRISRRQQPPVIETETVKEEVDVSNGPALALEQRERAEQVRRAISLLPETERVVVLLFYMGEHSQQQIAEFLEVPVTTVKRRLYTARQKLKARMIHSMQEEFNTQRPSRDSRFAERVRTFTNQFSRMVDDGKSLVYSLWRLAEDGSHPDLQDVIAQVKEDVEGGDTLSGALSKHPDVFSADYVKAVQEGELNGDLQQVLRRLGAA